uniref:LRRNT domain-containing protein n=1 Tax=Bracon brevicornis TaxID=1563983 RepID=A0A6V7HSX1_9HYME
MARAMTPSWSMRLLGVSCGSVVCAWGLLLVLSVLGGNASSHSADLGGFGFDNTGNMEDLNGPRCPWACSCEGQELDCAERGLTQVPGDLTVLAEKL